jgi:hypothetical protein
MNKRVHPEFLKMEKDITRILNKVTNIDLARLEREMLREEESSDIDSDDDLFKESGDEDQEEDQLGESDSNRDSKQPVPIDSDSDDDGLFD